MENIEKDIVKILEKHLDKESFAFFLFGSRVKGDYKKNSDFDIWVYGNKKMNFQKFLLLKEALETQVNHPVDIVDFQRCDSDFKNVAFRNIKIWNKPKGIELV